MGHRRPRWSGFSLWRRRRVVECWQTVSKLIKVFWSKRKKASDIFYLRYCFTFSRMWYNWYHAVYNLFQTERFVFNPWLGKIPWRRERLATPLFWPGEFCGPCSLWGCKESDITEQFSLSLSRPQIVGVILSLISIWNYPLKKTKTNHILQPHLPSGMARTLLLSESE